tara:strand:- start:515 stop:1744 length:1230 start_codon:yes stop_codon:yes gene_type:complete
MAQTVKVFKNVSDHAVATAAVGVSTEYNILTTTSTQQAVIKDVIIRGTNVATLDMDGMTALSSTTASPNMLGNGSLFMGPSSTLKVKLTPTAPSFRGMMWTNGSEGIIRTVGSGLQATTGTDTALTSVVKLSSTGINTNEAVATMIGEELNFFTIDGGTVRRYTETTTAYNGETTDSNFTLGGGTNHGLATDGVKYLYSIPGGTGTTIHRYNFLTKVTDSLTTNSQVQARNGNQGSFLEYHDGKLYTKEIGSTVEMFIIDLSDMSVITRAGMGLPGGYSDGGGIVTNLAGDSYVLEQSTSEWGYYKIGTDTSFTIVNNGTSASTEYGNGFMEVAPGIAYIYCEHADDLTIIDTNTTPPSWSHIASAATRNAAIEDQFGNRFSAAGFLVRPPASTTIDAYVSGVLVTEGI